MTDLSAEAVDAINRGRKIEAIKFVREQQGVGLKKAKELVDNYISENPDKLSIHANPKGSLNWSFFMLILILGAIIWVSVNGT